MQTRDETASAHAPHAHGTRHRAPTATRPHGRTACVDGIRKTQPVRVRLLSKGATRQEPSFLTEIAYMDSQEDHCSYHKEFHIRNDGLTLGF